MLAHPLRLLAPALLAIALAMPAHGQLRLTTADLPNTGDSLVVRYFDADNFLPGPNGVSQVWVHDTLTPRGAITLNYPAPQPTGKGVDSFPQASFYVDELVEPFAGLAVDFRFYYRNDSNAYAIQGTFLDSLDITAFLGSPAYTYANITVMRPQDTLYSFPVLYGSSRTYPTVLGNIFGRADVQGTLADVWVKRYSTRTVAADAWGSLITPDTTWDTTLRVHHTVQLTDSVFYAFDTNLAVTDPNKAWVSAAALLAPRVATRNEYHWFRPGLGLVMRTVQEIGASGAFRDTIAEGYWVEMAPDTTTPPDTPNTRLAPGALPLALQPNVLGVAGGPVVLAGLPQPSAPWVWQLVDAQGRTLHQGTAIGQRLALPALPAGLYRLVVAQAGRRGTAPLLVQP